MIALFSSHHLKLDPCPTDIHCRLTRLKNTGFMPIRIATVLATVSKRSIHTRPNRLRHVFLEASMETVRHAPSRTRNVVVDSKHKLDEKLKKSIQINAENIAARLARARARATPAAKADVKIDDLTMLSISPFLRSVQNWWLQRRERHYLQCADVELQRMREAQMNVAYFQKRAAMARSARA